MAAVPSGRGAEADLELLHHFAFVGLPSSMLSPHLAYGGRR
ncbi:hypothetical protein AB0I66_19515 [Streptomyces sp. NPDC050439]